MTRTTPGKWLAAALSVIFSLSAACQSQPIQSQEVGSVNQALSTNAARVLGFETPTADWSSPVGILGQSTTKTQGNYSLSVRPNGWTEIISVPLSSLGAVKNSLSFDIRLPSSLPWGEARAIVVLPSRAIWWQELGSRQLPGLTPGVFHKLSFTVPPNIEAALESTYSDLVLRVVINAPYLSSPILIDNLDLAEAAPGIPDEVKAALQQVEVAALASQVSLQTLKLQSDAALETEDLQPLAAGLMASAADAKTKASLVKAKVDAVSGDLGEQAETLVSISQTVEAVGSLLNAEASSLADSNVSARTVVTRLVDLADAARGAQSITQVEAGRIAAPSANLAEAAQRTNSMASGAESTEARLAMQAQRVRGDSSELSDAGATLAALEGLTDVTTAAEKKQVTRLAAKSGLSTSEKQRLEALTAVKQSAGSLAKAEALEATSMGARAKTAADNLESLSKAKEAVSSAIATKAKQLGASSQTKAVRAEQLSGAAAAVSKAGATLKKRLGEVAEKVPDAQTKDTLDRVDEIQKKVRDEIVATKDAVVSRSDVGQTDKNQLQALVSAVSDTVNKTSSAIATAKTGSDQVASKQRKNAQALAGAAEASAMATAAKAGRVKQSIQTKRSTAEELSGLSKSVAAAADAVKTRADAAAQEDAEQAVVQTLKDLEAVKKTISDVNKTAIDRVKARGDVVQDDKDDLNSVKTISDQLAAKTKAALDAANAADPEQYLRKLKNAQALLKAERAAAEALQSKGERVKEELLDKTKEADELKKLSDAASKAAEAVKTRAEAVAKDPTREVEKVRKQQANAAVKQQAEAAVTQTKDGRSKKQVEAAAKKAAEPATQDLMAVLTDLVSASEVMAQVAERSKERLKERSDVSAEEKTQLDTLSDAAAEVAIKRRALLESADATKASEARRKIRDVKSLTEVEEAAHQASKVKAESIRKDSVSKQTKAEELDGLSKATSMSTVAIKERAALAEAEPVTGELLDVLDDLFGASQSLWSVTNSSKSSLVALGNVEGSDRYDLNQLAGSRDQMKSKAQAALGATDLNDLSKSIRKIRDVTALAEAQEAVEEAIATKAKRVSKQAATKQREAEEVEGLQKAGAKLASAVEARAKLAEKETETQGLAQTLEDLMTMSNSLNTAALSSKNRLNARSDVPSADKAEIQSISDGTQNIRTQAQNLANSLDPAQPEQFRGKVRSIQSFATVESATRQAVEAKANKLKNSGAVSKTKQAAELESMSKSVRSAMEAVKQRAEATETETPSSDVMSAMEALLETTDSLHATTNAVKDRLAARSDVASVDKNEIAAATGLAATMRTKLHEAANAADPSDEAQFRGKLRDASALSELFGATQEAVASKASAVRQGNSQKQTLADELVGLSKATTLGASAAKKRAQASEEEAASAGVRDLLNTLLGATASLSATKEASEERLKARASAEDGADLTSLKQAVQELRAGAQQAINDADPTDEAQYRSRMRDAASLSAALEAAHDASATKAEKVREDVVRKSVEATELESLSKNGKAVAEAIKQRAAESEKEAASEAVISVLKKLADSGDKLSEVAGKIKDRLAARGDVEAAHKAELAELANSVSELEDAIRTKLDSADPTNESNYRRKLSSTQGLAQVAGAVRRAAEATASAVGETAKTKASVAESLRGRAESAEMASSGVAERAGKAERTSIDSAQVETVRQMADVTKKLRTRAIAAKDALKQRADVRAVDKSELDALTQTLEDLATKKQGTLDALDANDANDALGKLMSISALAKAEEAALIATKAKADRARDDSAKKEADSKEVQGLAKSFEALSKKLKERADQSKTEQLTADMLDTVKKIAQASGAISAVKEASKDRLAARTDVEAQDKSELDGLMEAVKQTVTKKQAEADAADLAQQAQTRRKIKSIAALASAEAALGSALSTKSDKVADVSAKKSREAVEVRGLAEAASASAKAVQQRGQEARKETQDSALVGVMAQLASAAGEIRAAATSSTARLNARTDVDQNLKNSLQGLMNETELAGSLGQGEIVRAGSLSGQELKAAVANTTALHGAASSASAVASSLGAKANELSSSRRAATNAAQGAAAGLSGVAGAIRTHADIAKDLAASVEQTAAMERTAITASVIGAEVQAQAAAMSARSDVPTKDKDNLANLAASAVGSMSSLATAASQSGGSNGASAVKNMGALAGGIASVASASESVSARLGKLAQNAAAEAASTARISGAAQSAAQSLETRAAQAVSEAAGAEQVQTLSQVNSMSSAVRATMGSAIADLQARSEVNTQLKQSLSALSDASEQSLATMASEIAELSGASNRTERLQRVESLGKALAAAAAGVEPQARQLADARNDKAAKLGTLRKLTSAAERASASLASQASVEDRQASERTAMAGTLQTIADSAAALASAQSRISQQLAAEVSDAGVAQSLASAASKAAEVARTAATDVQNPAKDLSRALSRVSGLSAAIKATSSSIGSEVQRLQNPMQDTESVKSSIASLGRAAASAATTVKNEVRGLRQGTTEATTGAELVQAMASAAAAASQAASADVDRLKAVSDPGEADSLGKLMAAVQAASSVAATQSDVLVSGAGDTAAVLRDLARLAATSATVGLAATLEAEKVKARRDSVPATAQGVMSAASAAQSAMDAVATEARRQQSAVGAGIGISQLAESMRAAAEASSAEAQRLQSESSVASKVAGLVQRASQAAAQAQTVATKAAEYASGGGASVLDQLISAAETGQLSAVNVTSEAFVLMTDEDFEDLSETGLQSLASATRAAALSASQMAQEAQLGSVNLTTAKSRLQKVQSLMASISGALVDTSEAVAVDLGGDSAKALRLGTLAQKSLVTAFELREQIDDLDSGGDPELALLFVEDLVDVAIGLAGSIDSERVEVMRLQETPPPSAGEEPEPGYGLNVSYTLFTDWGTGYCIGLNVNNPTTAATLDWLVSIDVGPDTIYDKWSADYSGVTGEISLASLYWNSEIQPGETNVSVGFCANRQQPNGTLPQIVGVAATFQ